MAIERSHNYRRVDERISSSGVVVASLLEQLSADGIQLMLNLLPEDNEYAVPREGDLVRAQGIEYVQIGVDFSAPGEDAYAAFAAVLDGMDGRRTHIHCAANYRVSAFLSRYRVDRGIWTPQDATGHIASLWNPEDYPPWPAFLARSFPAAAPPPSA